jgi:hypothetical protein
MTRLEEMNNLNTHFREQPDCAFPVELQRMGFTDQSWHNDACAKAGLFLREGDYEKDFVTVWCAEEKPEDREFPGSLRYMMDIVLEDDDHGSGEGFVLETDDIAKCVEIASAARTAFAQGGHEALVEYRKSIQTDKNPK